MLIPIVALLQCLVVSPLQVCPNQVGSSLKAGMLSLPFTPFPVWSTVSGYSGLCKGPKLPLWQKYRGADTRLAKKFGFFHKPEQAFWPTQYLVKNNKIFAFAWVIH